ncbi:uncharacterized protein LOC111376335 [Olea europaea var. sylvestris]|uniref:uncharacterized protein LOC111376335 n=1 Tax=Olea europaea var. sylvestris TaxID=158386 RepID=UPI000C1D19FA|nr:uncharacterized protein LOC111376335 [Olea europaea var. sylvestris]
MGKLICDSTASSPVIPWHDPTTTPSSLDSAATVAVGEIVGKSTPVPENIISWENVRGLEDQQKKHLTRLYNKGVLWKHPEDKSLIIVFKLSHGGEVEADGNCLFTAASRSMGGGVTARELRMRSVRRFVEDLAAADEETKGVIESAIRHMYAPDLKSGWGIHVVQEVKMLTKKKDREGLESSINELIQIGMQRYI